MTGDGGVVREIEARPAGYVLTEEERAKQAQSRSEMIDRLVDADLATLFSVKTLGDGESGVDAAFNGFSVAEMAPEVMIRSMTVMLANALDFATDMIRQSTLALVEEEQPDPWSAMVLGAIGSLTPEEAEAAAEAVKDRTVDDFKAEFTPIMAEYIRRLKPKAAAS